MLTIPPLYDTTSQTQNRGIFGPGPEKLDRLENDFLNPLKEPKFISLINLDEQKHIFA